MKRGKFPGKDEIGVHAVLDDDELLHSKLKKLFAKCLDGGKTNSHNLEELSKC